MSDDIFTLLESTTEIENLKFCTKYFDNLQSIIALVSISVASATSGRVIAQNVYLGLFST